MAETDFRTLEFELERAQHGMGMPYDAERVQQLRRMLAAARRRKLSDALARRRAKPVRVRNPNND